MPFDPKIVNFRVWRRKREIEDDRIDTTQVSFYSHKNVNTSSSNNQKILIIYIFTISIFFFRDSLERASKCINYNIVYNIII